MSPAIFRIGVLISLCFPTSCAPAIRSEPSVLPEISPPIQRYKGLVSKLRQQYLSDPYLIGIGQADSEKAVTELARPEWLEAEAGSLSPQEPEPFTFEWSAVQAGI